MTIAQFNRCCPPGTKVRVKRDLGEIVETTVKYEAQLLGGHTPVVWLDGISGCYLLSRVTPVPPAPAAEPDLCKTE